MGNVERCDKTLPLNEMMFHVRRDASLRARWLTDLEGTANMNIDGHEVVVPAGSIVKFPNGVMHDVRNLGTERCVIMFLKVNPKVLSKTMKDSHDG